MLLLYFLVSVSNSLMWVTTEPLVSFIEKAFSYSIMGTHSINWIVLIVAIIFIIPAGYYASNHSIKTCVWWAGIINLVGSGVRVLFWFHQSSLIFIIIG